MSQQEYFGGGSVRYVGNILKNELPKKIFLVTGKTSYSESGAEKILTPILKNYSITHFTKFSSNPKLKDIKKGTEIFREGYDLVIAVGGGSTIDTAKSINILSAQKGSPIDYIKKIEKIKNRGKPLIAIPTTAGSGSEATHFAVIYVEGVKYSLAHEFILPTYAIVDPLLALSMPKKVAASTAIDAFCQAIESYWSINSTDQSKSYASKAISLILKNIHKSANEKSKESIKSMSKAANLAGKAINISKTTAPHALSYTLTSHFGIQHGHAAALTLGQVLVYNADITDDDCNDKRGKYYVKKTIDEIVSMLGCANPHEANLMIKSIMKDVGLEINTIKLGIKDEDIEDIIDNINYERLKNNPRKFIDKNSLRMLFKI